MSYASAFSIIGWVTILLGVNLLIAFGMPFRVLTGGLNGMLFEQPDPKDVSAANWYDVLGLFGLALIVLGVGAQIKAILLP